MLEWIRIISAGWAITLPKVYRLWEDRSEDEEFAETDAGTAWAAFQ